MPTKQIEVVINHAAIDDLVGSESVRTMLAEAARPIVADARGRAPKATGRGSRSIEAVTTKAMNEWEALISWDQHHYYMYFSEKGDKQRPAKPFLVPALEAAQH